MIPRSRLLRQQATIIRTPGSYSDLGKWGRIVLNGQRRQYDTQSSETTKQDGFDPGFGPYPGPWKSIRKTLLF